MAETKESGDITEKSNVYTLGLVLIQLLTGKMAVHRQEVVEWARSDRRAEIWVVDGAVTGATEQDQMVGFMNLALDCTADDPMARPSSEVAYKTMLNLCRTACCSKLLLT